MNNIKHLFILAIGVWMSTNVFSQQFGLYTLDYVPQRQYLNPAFNPKGAKANIGLPVLSYFNLNLLNSGFRMKDILVDRPGDDSTLIDLNAALGSLKKNNYLGFGLRTDLLSFGFTIMENNYVSFHSSVVQNFRLRYPKDFFSFIIEGNAPSMGETLNFNFGLYQDAYIENAIALSRKMNDRLRVGLSGKYLMGIVNVNTKRSDITMFTDPNNLYDITVSSDIAINVATPIDTGGNFQLSNLVKNSGFAIDLGATYQITEKIEVSASVLNLGFINWKSNTTNLSSENPGASFTYQGLELNDFFNGSDTSFVSGLEKLQDSLKNTFKIIETNNAYKTILPLQIHLSGTYALPFNQSVGGHLYGTFIDKNLRPGLSLFYTKNLGKWFAVSAMYSIYNRAFDNLGLALRINGGPIQFYFAADNIIKQFSPLNARYTNLSTGININLGRKDKKEASKENKKAEDAAEQSKEDKQKEVKKRDEDNLKDKKENKDKVRKSEENGTPNAQPDSKRAE